MIKFKFKTEDKITKRWINAFIKEVQRNNERLVVENWLIGRDEFTFYLNIKEWDTIEHVFNSTSTFDSKKYHPGIISFKFKNLI